MPEYNLEAMRKMADTLGRKAGHFGQVGDGLPKLEDEKAFGDLDSSKHVVSGVHQTLSGFNDQFATAEKHLKGMSEALARAADKIQAQDDESRRVVTPTEKQA